MDPKRLLLSVGSSSTQEGTLGSSKQLLLAGLRCQRTLDLCPHRHQGGLHLEAESGTGGQRWSTARFGLRHQELGSGLHVAWPHIRELLVDV